MVQAANNKNPLSDLLLTNRTFKVAWEDGRSDPSTGAERTHMMEERHTDTAFHPSALEALNRGRASRAWTNDRILEAIADFIRTKGRRPKEHEFHSKNGLPSYKTVWKHFGSMISAMDAACAGVLDEGT